MIRPPFALACVCLLSAALPDRLLGEEPAGVQLEAVAEIHLDQPIGQLRACPVTLGASRPRGIAAIFGSDAEIDPYIGMFFFPRSTLRIRMFDEHGKTHWEKDLGPGVVPGIWFCPMYAFDLDQDGVDEIWYVDNRDSEHPLDYRKYELTCLDPLTGKKAVSKPWPSEHKADSLSHQYRNFIMGGFVRGQPVLITAQGTYGEMAIQAWNPDLSHRWTKLIKPAVDRGALGSHVCPVVDLNGDGVDELLWGERAIELDQGQELFCAGKGEWSGHSDIIQPVLDRQTGRWLIHTCRETSVKQGPRIVMFDDQGKQVWGHVDEGHIDTGWAARLGSGGEPVVLGVKVGEKVRSARGERRLWTRSYTFHALSGEPFELPFDPYTTIPVDLNGDGLHELVKGYFEGDGTVLDRTGKVLGNVGGLTAICSKFTNRPGEQILSYDRDGRVGIWADLKAIDSDRARQRYASRYYYINQRMTACGYNLFSLGGF